MSVRESRLLTSILNAVLIVALLMTVTAPERALAASEGSTSHAFVPGEASYRNFLPRWGFELSASGGGAGPKFTGAASKATNQLTGIAASLDYQPGFLQKFGVFSLGPTFIGYTQPMRHSMSELMFGWSMGAKASYQLKFFDQQVIVPVVSYEASWWNYRLRSHESGALTAKGPGAGIWLLLNAMDQRSGESFFADYGIARAYLVAEYRKLTGSDRVLSFTGDSYYIGVRFEF